MSNKGLIFSLTAIYYAVVIMLFLSLMFFSVTHYSTTRGQEKLYYSGMSEAISGSSESISESEWCSIYFRYDADSSILLSQSELEVLK